MKKLFSILAFLSVLSVAFAAGRFSESLPARAEGSGGGSDACEADRTLYSVDTNGDANVDLSDAVYLLRFLFSGGPAPQVCPGGSLAECEAALAAVEAQVKTLVAELENLEDEVATLTADRDDLESQLTASQAEIAACLSRERYPVCARAAERFVEHGDGTVTDTCTGLMWMQGNGNVPGDGDERVAFQTAVNYAENLILAGHDDWRLPSIEELLTLLDHTTQPPSLTAPFVQGSLASQEWSSSLFGDGPPVVRIVQFSSAIAECVIKHLSQDDETYVRAVRTVD